MRLARLVVLALCACAAPTAFSADSNFGAAPRAADGMLHNQRIAPVLPESGERFDALAVDVDAFAPPEHRTHFGQFFLLIFFGAALVICAEVASRSMVSGRHG